MTVEDNRVIALRYANSLWGEGDLGVVDEICAPDVWVHPPNDPDGYHGAKAVKNLVQFVRRVIPDLRIQVDEVIAEGDKVVVRWTGSGTQLGAWTKVVAPTGKHVAWTGISIYRIRDGKISDEWVEENLLGLEEQMGLVERRSVG